MLTDTAIKKAKPQDTPYKLADGGGLHLTITPAGGKLWRFNYRLHGKYRTLAIGKYPQISLKEAREIHFKAKSMIELGQDPAMNKRIEKQAKRVAATNSFEAIAREWMDIKREKWVESHAKRNRERMENNLFPYLGHRPINDITTPELLAVLRRVESRGALDLASRLRQLTGSVYRYAIACGRAERDIAADLRGAIATRKKVHHATIKDPKKIGQLMRDIDAAEGSFVAKQALRLSPYVFVRPGELRHAEWQDIDLDTATWKIPEHKMKMKRDHIVPLSTQAVEILREIQPLTGPDGEGYVFPFRARLALRAARQWWPVFSVV